MASCYLHCAHFITLQVSKRTKRLHLRTSQLANTEGGHHLHSKPGFQYQYQAVSFYMLHSLFNNKNLVSNVFKAHLPFGPAGRLDHRRHAISVQTFGLGEVDHIENNSLKDIKKHQSNIKATKN